MRPGELGLRVGWLGRTGRTDEATVAIRCE